MSGLSSTCHDGDKELVHLLFPQAEGDDPLQEPKVSYRLNHLPTASRYLSLIAELSTPLSQTQQAEEDMKTRVYTTDVSYSFRILRTYTVSSPTFNCIHVTAVKALYEDVRREVSASHVAPDKNCPAMIRWVGVLRKILSSASAAALTLESGKRY